MYTSNRGRCRPTRHATAPGRPKPCRTPDRCLVCIARSTGQFCRVGNSASVMEISPHAHKIPCSQSAQPMAAIGTPCLSRSKVYRSQTVRDTLLRNHTRYLLTNIRDSHVTRKCGLDTAPLMQTAMQLPARCERPDQRSHPRTNKVFPVVIHDYGIREEDPHTGHVCHRI